MTDWIEHTTDTCPVDPETVVEVRYRNPWKASLYWLGWHLSARSVEWRGRDITHYRIITPAPTPPLFLGGDPVKPAWLDDPDPGADPAKPPEPEGKEIDPSGTQMWFERKLDDGRIVRCRVTAVGPNGAVPPTDDAPEVTFKCPLLEDPEPEMTEPDLITLRLECMKMAVSHFSILDREQAADRLLHYVLNGSVDKA
jgi:hypothetical protein